MKPITFSPPCREAMAAAGKIQCTARNLWHNPQSAYSRKVFVYRGPALLTHRGVEVRKNPAGSWDYLAGDATIMQRAGFLRSAAPAIIDEVLDGAHPIAPEVAAHLRALGHKPMTYAEYNAKPETWAPTFREEDCGGAFDGNTVTSDADPGL